MSGVWGVTCSVVRSMFLWWLYGYRCPWSCRTALNQKSCFPHALNMLNNVVFITLLFTLSITCIKILQKSLIGICVRLFRAAGNSANVFKQCSCQETWMRALRYAKISTHCWSIRTSSLIQHFSIPKTFAFGMWMRLASCLERNPGTERSEQRPEPYFKMRAFWNRVQVFVRFFLFLGFSPNMMRAASTFQRRRSSELRNAGSMNLSWCFSSVSRSSRSEVLASMSLDKNTA